MKVTNSPREVKIKKLFRALHENLALNFVMRTMRGSIKAQTLLVAPPPDRIEYETEQVPFSNEAARRFHDLLSIETGLSTEKHFCVIAASVYSEKTNKDGSMNVSKNSSLLVRAFVEQCAKQGLFKRFISVGREAYHSIFGDHLVSGPFNPGCTLYPLQLKYKDKALPLLVLPDVSPLVLTAEEGTRDFYIQKRMQEKLASGLVICAKIMKQKFLK